VNLWCILHVFRNQKCFFLMITYCHRCTVMKTEKVRVLEVFLGVISRNKCFFFTKFTRGLHKVTPHNLNTYCVHLWSNQWYYFHTIRKSCLVILTMYNLNFKFYPSFFPCTLFSHQALKVRTENTNRFWLNVLQNLIISPLICWTLKNRNRICGS